MQFLEPNRAADGLRDELTMSAGNWRLIKVIKLTSTRTLQKVMTKFFNILSISIYTEPATFLVSLSTVDLLEVRILSIPLAVWTLSAILSMKIWT